MTRSDVLPRPMYAWGEGRAEGRRFEGLAVAEQHEDPPLTLTLSPCVHGARGPESEIHELHVPPVKPRDCVLAAGVARLGQPHAAAVEHAGQTPDSPGRLGLVDRGVAGRVVED